MEQKIQEIIEENGANNTGKLRIFDNTLLRMEQPRLLQDRLQEKENLH